MILRNRFCFRKQSEKCFFLKLIIFAGAGFLNSKCNFNSYKNRRFTGVEPEIY